MIEDSTREGYTYLINRYLLPELGDYRLRDIAPETVRQWITRLGSVHGANPPTIRTVKKIFDAVMATAVNDRILHYHPGRGIKTPPVPRKPLRILTTADYQRLHDSLATPEMQLLVEFDIETGLRWGELTELRPKDIRFDTAMLTVSRVVIHLHARPREDAPRFKVKDYPKDKEWRQTGTRWLHGRKVRNRAGETLHYPPVAVITESPPIVSAVPVARRAHDDRRPAPCRG